MDTKNIEIKTSTRIDIILYLHMGKSESKAQV